MIVGNKNYIRSIPLFIVVLVATGIGNSGCRAFTASPSFDNKQHTTNVAVEYQKVSLDGRNHPHPHYNPNRHHQLRSPLCMGSINQDFPPEDDNISDGSDVDWDAEWKKVVSNQEQPEKRPGKDFYKSEAEIAGIRAANRASKSIDKTASNINLPSIPSNLSFSDPKVIIAIIAIISIGLSILTAQPDPYASSISSQDSLYI